MGVGMGLGPPRGRMSRDRAKDLSDIVRCVGLSKSTLINDASFAYAHAMGEKGGFKIHVDPSHVDPDIGDIVLVKKSRVTPQG
ncbi:hypothetical protein CVT25_013626 [Psilocybe cyanescens]|uniref:Uncharacterized protein n=1 Tax=Psilocybe cyanescens TaxID=93625 RepID=A0A409WTD7_PSICY|nr:hypothetical protein CVT25_013626 [Psilocybe cyanescens]